MQFLEEVLLKHKDEEKDAVVFGEGRISYSELFRRSMNLAHRLMECGIKPNDRVIILLPKSVEFIVNMFAILMVGGTYIPIDHEIPSRRLEFIMDECRPVAVIVKANDQKKLSQYEMDKVENTIYWRKDYVASSEKIERSERDICYIIYTSGSTGKPKGVKIRHESAVCFVEATNELVGYGKETRYLNVSPFYFDACIVDIFCTFAAGGTLVLMDGFVLPNDLVSTLLKYQITDTLLVSSVLKLLVSRFSNLSTKKLPCLRTIWYGAESCPVEIIRQIKDILPHIWFVHGYGPTEATHTTTAFLFQEIDDKYKTFMPIGKPLKHVTAYAVNSKGSLIKENEVGELYVGGKQLMEGYVNEELNRVAMVKINGIDETVYKTGDFVTLDQDGNYIYVGRKDDMIKLGGKLISLLEIEKTLLKHKCIKDAVAVSKEDILFNKTLWVFIKVKEEMEMNEKELIAYMEHYLPDFMIPKKIIEIKSEFPRKGNGKIDKEQLLSQYCQVQK